MAFRTSVEMSIGREEFLRLLAAAVGPFLVAGDAVRPSDGHRNWVIQLERLADHRVGSVVLPRHRVDIVLETSSNAEGATFMARFHRAFLRGGG